MTEDPASGDETEQEHPTGVFRGLFVSAIEAVRTRLDLAAVEAEIFMLRAVQLLLWAFAAVACGLLALAFVVVAIVAALWDTHRMAGVLGGALLFVVLSFVFGFIASRIFKARPHMLAGTLAQLERDQQHVGGTS